MARPLPIVLTDETEDFTKNNWDFWREDGSKIDTIGELCDVLLMGRIQVAQMVMVYPYPGAVPPKLLAEAGNEYRS